MPCTHISLHVAAPFDSPKPVQCSKCQASFELREALDHIRPLQDAYLKLDKINLSRLPEYPRILMAYGVASREWDEREGAGRALPDLDIDMGHITELDANIGLNDLIIAELQERADRGQYPPWPRPLERLKQNYPKYAGWEWTEIAIEVTEYLEPLVS
jgi:hypothetical protein